jgi:hypothetical protein
MSKLGGRCVIAGLLACLTSYAHALDGRVLNAKTHAGIAGATVTYGTAVATTDAGGQYQVAGSGGTVFARAIGFKAASMPVAGNGTTDIELTAFQPHALYLSVYGIGSKVLLGSALQLVRTGSINALVVDVKGDRGLIPYPTAIPLALKDGARKMTTIPDLSRLVARLHQDGIYAIARIVVFKDVPLATARPDLAVRRSSGALYVDREGLSWTDPFQQQVRDYNIAIAVDAARAGFDEIQFDYVRFPDTEGLRFSQDPTEAARVQAIDDFLAQARKQLAPYNVYLSVDIFGYVLWNTNDTGIGQQLEELSKYVDYISPMLYPSAFQYGIPGFPRPIDHPYEIVRNSLDNANRRAKISPDRFRPWLQAFTDYAFNHRRFGPAEVQAETRAASDFGTDGWLLWNPRNQYEGLGLTTPQGHEARAGDTK